MKQILLCIFVIFFSFTKLNVVHSITGSPIEDISMITLDSMRLDSEVTEIDSLKQLFIETIYTTFVKEEIRSFSRITEILSKPFTKLWLVIPLIVQSLRTLVVGFVSQIRLFFESEEKFVINSTLPVLLFYFITHLKIRKVAPLVLRC